MAGICDEATPSHPEASLPRAPERRILAHEQVRFKPRCTRAANAPAEEAAGLVTRAGRSCPGTGGGYRAGRPRWRRAHERIATSCLDLAWRRLLSVVWLCSIAGASATAPASRWKRRPPSGGTGGSLPPRSMFRRAPGRRTVSHEQVRACGRILLRRTSIVRGQIVLVARSSPGSITTITTMRFPSQLIDARLERTLASTLRQPFVRLKFLSAPHC